MPIFFRLWKVHEGAFHDNFKVPFLAPNGNVSVEATRSTHLRLEPCIGPSDFGHRNGVAEYFGPEFGPLLFWQSLERASHRLFVSAQSEDVDCGGGQTNFVKLLPRARYKEPSASSPLRLDLTARLIEVKAVATSTAFAWRVRRSKTTPSGVNH